MNIPPEYAHLCVEWDEKMAEMLRWELTFAQIAALPTTAHPQGLE